MAYYVYILTNRKRGTFYVGLTNNLERRMLQHKTNYYKGFSFKYNTKKLVYYEVIDNLYIARERENRLKRWERRWKIELIENQNPEWIDLCEQ